ncbi:MAG: FAD-dependent oxidoreductase [Negativicutes bacterium]|nr:FAD-dependent oxidoreductase [Negativicutes bacterium]
MFKISTLNGNERMSTQELLQAINAALAAGETEYEIEASGQHDIGGPLWHPEGKPLKFIITNPGQRVGSMCLEGTEIIVEGPAPADVGWLNAGGKIIVRGDGGDTAGHCAASGKIYIGGRAGTRSGSLMKHDPLYEPPELWILKNTGSFSFEFMGGGIAVVCGYDSEQFDSVLGDRSCVGMVGGKLYVRGPIQGISAKDVKIMPLCDSDIAWLAANMPQFLNEIGRADLGETLTRWEEWRKVLPLTYDERPKKLSADIRSFRLREWVQGGIFSDVCQDDYAVMGLVAKGLYRQRIPVWENARYNAPCEFNCTASIPTQQRFNLLREGKIEEAYRLVLDYTPFPGSVCGAVCPNPCMESCTRGEIDYPAQINALGAYSAGIPAPTPAANTGKKVAVIGGGPAGLTAAWQLARKGHQVTVYEADDVVGGKLEQAIPRSRLPREVLLAEINRIRDIGVAFQTGVKVDREMFAQIKAGYDAVVVATGAHVPRVFPWPGHERIVKGLDFLKAINRGERPQVGRRVVVIGCGNSGMDAAVGAYQLGAEQVVLIDVQQPAAFPKEIAHVEAMGGVLMWPVIAKEITEQGVVTATGDLIPADTVIITVGETPDLSFLPEGAPLEKGLLKPDHAYRIADGVFTAGDTIRPGRLVDAIGTGREAALAVDAYLKGETFAAEAKNKIALTRISKAYFKRLSETEIPAAGEDYQRCISCGSCRDCHMCMKSCPENAITRIVKPDGTFAYVSDDNRCIGCGICAGVCPCGVWAMHANAKPIPMYTMAGIS